MGDVIAYSVAIWLVIVRGMFCQGYIHHDNFVFSILLCGTRYLYTFELLLMSFDNLEYVVGTRGWHKQICNMPL